MYSLWNTENKSKLPHLIWRSPLAACFLSKYLSPWSFFSLNFFTISNCRCFSACYEKLWGGERADTTSWVTLKPVFFSDQKVSSRLFLEIYCSLAFIPTFLTPVVFQLPSILFQPCSVPVSQVEGRLATLHPVLRWLDSLVWVSESARQLDAFRARCILSNTVFYLSVMVMSQLGKVIWGRGRFSLTWSYYIKAVSF